MKHLKKHTYTYGITILFVGSLVLNEVAKTHFISIFVMTLLSLLAGFKIFKQAFIDLKYRIIGIDLLVSIAVISAFIIGDYFEAAAVTYLFTMGHILEKHSLEKTRSALKALMDLKPQTARRILNNQEAIIPLEALSIDDLLLVKPGEKIPADGKIIEGEVYIDEQMMTGESMPVLKTVGDSVYGSTLLKSGYIKMRTTHIGEDTTLSRIIHMVEEAQDKKAKTEKFMDNFSKYYTPLVVLIAIVMFVLTKNIRLAVTVLVIACPGALVIATPVSFVAGIGNGAKKGILFKGGDSIERLAKSTVVFFDKTGTLTEGKPSVTQMKTFGIDPQEAIKIAAIGESYSEHPLSIAILDFAKKNGIDTVDEPLKPTILIGKGIQFGYNEVKYQIGNEKWINVKEKSVQTELDSFLNQGLTTIILAEEDKILALFGIQDTLREKAVSTIDSLKALGIKETIMLTGDHERVARAVKETLHLDHYHAGLLPEDKSNIIKSYTHEHTLFVGDGINDALALTYADASVAMGGLGKDLAMETADVVLLSEDISKLTQAIKISRKVKSNMIQNITFALLVVFALMIGVLFNQVTMSIGMLVHELSVLLVLINAMRLLKYDLGGTHVEGKRKQLYRNGTNL